MLRGHRLDQLARRAAAANAQRTNGTTDAPETDILARVGRAAAEDAVKDQANKLLKKFF